MLLIGPGTVYTRDPENPVIRNGAVLTENDQILEVGSFDALRSDYPQADWVDAHGQIIHPAFINTHHHIYSALARGLSIRGYDPKNFVEILEGLWWKLDDHLLHDDTRASAVATYISCIQNGVATVFDHHASYGQTEGTLAILAEEAKRFGLRACLCYEISDRRGEAEMKKAVRENVSFIHSAQSEEYLCGTMGMHAPFTLSDETLHYCKQENVPDAGYHIHVAEGKEDAEHSLKEYGVPPIERLHRLGLLGPKTIAGHCIHLTEKEKDLLKETDTIVIHNPESNMGNAVGYPDVLGMYRRGILIGLGTDAYTSDMLESYKAANFLCKFFNGNGNVGWTEISALLFDHNPKIVRRFFPDAEVGILRKGARADVIILDYEPQTPMNAENLNSHLLFGMNGLNVVTTITQGQVRMLDRAFQGMDERALLRDCAEQAQDLWNRVNA